MAKNAQCISLNSDPYNESVIASPVPSAVLIAKGLSMSSSEEDLQIRTLHHQWKQQQGYSLTEIERKSRSIANVMPVDTLAVHKERLETVGFSTIVQWSQHFNFVALLAVKQG